MLSRAVIAAQRITAGEIHIRVVEDFIDHVTIQGTPDPVLRGYADRLTASHPLNAADLERYLPLINDLPREGAAASPKPPSTPPGCKTSTASRWG